MDERELEMISTIPDFDSHGIHLHVLRELLQPLMAVELATIVDEEDEPGRVGDRQISEQEIVEYPGALGFFWLRSSISRATTGELMIASQTRGSRRP